MDTAPTPPLSLLIGLIAYDAKPDVVVSNSLNNLTLTLMRNGVQFGVMDRTQEADLGRTRNGLAAEMKAGPYTHLLALDGDVAYQPDDVIRLISLDLDFVCGAYPRRDDSGAFSLRPRPGPLVRIDPKTRQPHPSGLLDVIGAPMGFALISRRCIDKMVEGYPDRWYNDVAVTGGKAWSFWEFTPDFVDRERHSEDYTFCRMWREIGGTVWVDPTLRLTHIGRKSWTGRMTDKMKVEKAGSVPEDFLKSLA